MGAIWSRACSPNGVPLLIAKLRTLRVCVAGALSCWLWCCRYEIYAISRPATLLALASYPLTRYYQGRFRRESMAAVRDATESC